MTSTAFRYRVFISYSHADKKAAAWLHRRLEGYHFPKGTLTLAGEPPTRLNPVFRDREELRAGSSLSDALQAALGESDGLVLIASPRAASSPWVGREIARFLDQGRPERLFTFIVDGNPGAVPGASDDCFPPVLRERGVPEFVAADARPEGDGRQLAFLKLVAGLADVPLDTLVRRDHQRSMRRLRWLVAGALSLTLVFAGLGTALFFQRREALRQRDLARAVRDQAQELNTFFIVDLRTRLRAVGRVELLDEATQRVLAYHEALPPELAADAATRRAHAIALDYTGQIKMVRGDRDGAVALLEKSRAAWLALLADSPGHAEAIQGYAVCCKMLGDARRGDLEKELTSYREGVETLGQLRAVNDSGASRLARLRAMLLTSAGEALAHQGESKAALRELDAAAAAAKEAVELDPKERSPWVQASESFRALADHYFRIDDLPAALAQANAASKAAQVVVDRDEDHPDAWLLLANAQGPRIMVPAARKEWPAAEAAAREQLRIRERISQRDPQNPSATAFKANAHDDLAFTLSAQKKVEEAVREFSTAIRLLTSLTQLYPSRQDWRRELALVFKRRGDLAFECEAWEVAQEDYEQSRNLRAALVEADPKNARSRLELANLQLAIGEVFQKQGKKTEATGSAKQAQETLASPAIPPGYGEAIKMRQNIEAFLRDLAR